MSDFEGESRPLMHPNKEEQTQQTQEKVVLVFYLIFYIKLVMY